MNPIIRMKREITAGIIVFRRTSEGLKFLILYHRGGYWNFPKGHIDAEEKSWQAALREVREETGLKSTELRFVQNFKERQEFVFNREKEKVFKVVILFLAETRQPRITVSYEHAGYGWFAFPDAKKIMGKYKDNVRILENAYAFLRGKRISSGRPHPQRPNPHVPGGRAPGGEPTGVPSSRQHPQ